uniref:Ulp1 protease family, C-terminal catalytic domain-containing protein n=2 Tax=Caenorhabditis tropicalis TaxID=1561998 RepID=A0A1I7UVF2_9PELO
MRKEMEAKIRECIKWNFEFISEYVPVDCSTLNECGGNWACVEYLMTLYRLDCVAGPVSKKSSFVNGGGKRGGMKNLQKIFLGSYMTKLR